METQYSLAREYKKGTSGYLLDTYCAMYGLLIGYLQGYNRVLTRVHTGYLKGNYRVLTEVHAGYLQRYIQGI